MVSLGHMDDLQRRRRACTNLSGAPTDGFLVVYDMLQQNLEQQATLVET